MRLMTCVIIMMSNRSGCEGVGRRLNKSAANEKRVVVGMGGHLQPRASLSLAFSSGNDALAPHVIQHPGAFHEFHSAQPAAWPPAKLGYGGMPQRGRSYKR